MSTLIYFSLAVHHHLSASSVLPWGCLLYLWPFGLLNSKDTQSFVHGISFYFITFCWPLLVTHLYCVSILSSVHPCNSPIHHSMCPSIHPSMSFDASKANSATVSTIPQGCVSYLRPSCLNALSTALLWIHTSPERENLKLTVWCRGWCSQQQDMTGSLGADS